MKKLWDMLKPVVGETLYKLLKPVYKMLKAVELLIVEIWDIDKRLMILYETRDSRMDFWKFPSTVAWDYYVCISMV